MNQVLLDLTTRSVACLSPRLSTFIHFTYSPTVHLWYPAHIHRKLWPVTQVHECLKLFMEYLDSSEAYIFSPDASLRSSVTSHGWLAGVDSADWHGECMKQSVWLFSEPLDSLNPRPPLPLWPERESQPGHAGANACSCTYKLSRL